MKTKLLLLLFLFFAGAWLQAQETVRSLIISEARFDEPIDAYVELTNMGDSALHLRNFEFGVVHPWDSRIDGTDINKWFNVGANSWLMLPDVILAPGKSFVLTGDSMSAISKAGEVWQGRECWYVKYHNAFWSDDPVPVLIKDSIVTDQVGGVFTDPDGRQAWGGKDVAGVSGATGHSILVRKFIVKLGNIDFENGRGTNASESEWIVIPTDIRQGGGGLFWTVGNHVNANLEPGTLTSSTVSINWLDSTLVIPYGVRRDDSVMHRFFRKPGIAWQYHYSASYEDSAYMSVRTGDALTVYACGDKVQIVQFRIIASAPAADANIVIPMRKPDRYLSFAGQGALFEVTDRVPGMDTIRSNIVYGIAYATRVDTLFKYLQKEPTATWEIIFVDGQTRPDLKNGDILRVTSEDDHVKDYFIKVRDFQGDMNAELSSLTWPDIPEDYRGLFGWAGDTIPGFQSSKFNYKIVVPYEVTGIPALVAKTADVNATLLVNRAKNIIGTVADRTITFTSTASDGEHVLTYTVELVKGKDPSDVQPWKGEPFISEYCFRQDYSNDFLEIVNPGTEPLDLRHYMLTFSGVNDPADAIAGNADGSSAAWANRYVKYIPGMSWQDSTDWKNRPAIAVPDPSGIQPVVLSGDVFVMADKRSVGGTAADYLVPRIDLDFAHNPWNETIAQVNAMDQGWAVMNKTILFKILNDSVYKGIKPATDPKDFQIIDMLGYNSPSSTRWIAGGVTADPASDWTRKEQIYKGNPLISTGIYPGGSFGTDESNSEWNLLNESLLSVPPYNYNWPATRIHLADGIGSHSMDEVTVYKSTVSSLIYKVTPGYKKESIWGVLPGTRVAEFKSNILKADTAQQLSLFSHNDGSLLNDSIQLFSDDTLLVISADSVNRTRYILTLTPGGLSKNDTLTSLIYTIEINDSVGIISGFSYGTLLKDVFAGVDIPAGCTFNVINGSNGYQPLKVLNSDTLYIDVRVTDNIFFEVIAENGINKIVYQLKPDALNNDAFVTSDFYEVDQEAAFIGGVPNGTSVSGLLQNLTPAPGATMKVIDKYGFERTMGIILKDDKLVVTAQDGVTSRTYYFWSCCPPPPDLVYALSDVYLVNQINLTIEGNFSLLTLVSDFLANLIPAPGATLKVLNSQGIENTGMLSIGDYLEVTGASQNRKVYYSISFIFDAIRTINFNSISIYPNPTSGNFNVTGFPAGSKIVIKNMLGKSIFETLVNDDNLQYSLEDQPAGVYFILIGNNSSLSGYKLIVK